MFLYVFISLSAHSDHHLLAKCGNEQTQLDALSLQNPSNDLDP